MRVVSATVNGAPVSADAFDADAGRLRIGGLAAENEIVVVAEHAYEHTGVGLHRFVDPVDGAVYLHTQFEPFDAHRVFPSFDQPDLKATFTFEVEAPAGWEVVSNAAATDRPADGAAGRWRFATTEKMSTYITALVAGPYHSVHRSHPGGRGVPESSIEMGLYCRQSLARYLDADEIFDVTAAGFDFFEDAFGQPYAVREVRPALRAGVQLRGHGERRLRHVLRAPHLPVQGDGGASGRIGPTRSSTRWPTCGSAIS